MRERGPREGSALPIERQEPLNICSCRRDEAMTEGLVIGKKDVGTPHN